MRVLNDRVRHVITRTLAFGTALCGAAIIYSGMVLHSRAGLFKENLDALAATIRELDRTVVELRRDMGDFNNYLGVLRKSLDGTQSNIGDLNKESGDFIVLVGTTAPKLITDSVTLIQESAQTLKTTANQAGKIPTDPLASQRASMYQMAGTLSGSAQTLKSASSDISGLATQIGETTKRSLETVGVVLEATDGQIGMLKDGSLKHAPAVMESMSSQLSTHLQLIESSYNLVHQVTVPITAVGFGFLFVGLWGILLSFPGRQVARNQGIG